MTIVPRHTRRRTPTAAPEDAHGPDRPLSLPQQQLWFMDRVQPGGSLYNLPVVLRLRGALDLGVLQRCLRDIVTRHEVLRTRFPDRDGVPVQVTAAGAHVPLPVHDLSAAPADEREDLLRKLVTEETHAPFDLAEGPVLRAALVRAGATDHVLVLTFHHIVFDGSSCGVLLAELGELYTAHTEGREPGLPTLTLQYADYAERSRTADVGSQLRYWQERFATAPPTLQLPADRPRPAVQSYQGAAAPFEVGPELTSAVERLAEEEGVTPFAVMLSAFFVLLARYTGQHDLAVGVPVVRRPEPDLDPLIGCFVNTLAIRADVDPAAGFRPLLAQVAESVYAAFENMDVQFDDVVRVVEPERDPSYSPLVQASFGMLAAGQTGELTLPGLTAELLEDERLTSKFDLSLDLIQKGDGFQGELEYATDLFDAATMRRAAGHWLRLLTELVAAPDAPVATVPLLTPEEEHRQLRAWNDTAFPVGEEPTMHALFEAQVARTPDAPAVVKGEDRLTYAELDRRANRLAHLLRRRGVRAETPVGVCMERGVDTVVAFLGVLKSGGVYVPLDPEYPRERLEYMLAHAAVPLVVTTTGTLRDLPPVQGALLLDEEAELLAGLPDTAPDAEAGPDNLSCMFYTSGSTGTPKCAMVTHANYVNYYRFWESAYLGGHPMRSHLQMTSFAFDIFIADATRALFSGAKLVVVPHETVMSPPDLYRLMVAEDVNSAEFITPILAALVDHLEETGADLAFLDLLVAGSDIWYARDYMRVRALCRPDTQIVAAYGLSETAIDNATLARAEVPEVIEGIVPIGRPTGNNQVYVLNDRLQPQPVGVPGELYVGGAGVGRGYHRDAARTAQRYLPDPFSAEPGARLYRSGDLARYRPDGVLEILGRIDNQVKVNGFRIELGEIESVLRAHPDVDNAVVVVHTASGTGETRLVGYVTFVGAARPDLTPYLVDRLPAYMLPSVLVTLDEMPLNANGKINRRALPEPASAAGGDAARGGAPRTPVEEILAGIWAEVLGLTEVGRSNNFFALGGSSLLMTQVVSRMRRVLGRDVPLRVLYQHPTVAALAAELARAGDGREERPVTPVPRDPAGHPLSYAQEQLWFLDRLGEGDVSYNVPETLRLRGPLDTEALATALQALADRHEALRTVYVRGTAGRPVQLVRDTVSVPLKRADLSGLDATTRDAAVRGLIRADELLPFDLEHGPLIRATLVTTGEDEHLLLLDQHHIATDGWSSGVLLRELSELYTAHTEGRPADLAPLPLQYADFAVWQRDWLDGEEGRRGLAHWRERLLGAPGTTTLPLDRPRTPAVTRAGASVAFTVPDEVYGALRAYGRERGATLFMTLLAAFDVLLARSGGDAELVVGTPASGRTRVELEPVLGFFTNVLALRTRVDDDPVFADLLTRVRDTALDGYAHQDVPFERVVEELRPRRDLGHNPVFQVVFSLDDAGGDALTLPGVTAEEVRPAYSTAKFDLELMLEQRDGALGGTFTYRTDLFDAATVETLCAAWLRLLGQLAADTGRRISAYELPELDALGTAPEAPAADAPAPVTGLPGPDGELLGRVLGALWAEVLLTDAAPDPRDDFFVLGGHSLLVTQVTYGIGDLLGLAVPVRALFENPTLGAFTAEVGRRAAEEGGAQGAGEFAARLRALAEQI